MLAHEYICLHMVWLVSSAILGVCSRLRACYMFYYPAAKAARPTTNYTSPFGSDMLLTYFHPRPRQLVASMVHYQHPQQVSVSDQGGKQKAGAVHPTLTRH